MALLNSPLFQVAENSGNRITLRSPQGHVAHVCVLEEDIVRVMVLPFGKLRLPRSWAIAPGADDLPVEGRDRFDLSGFSLPDFTLDAEPDRLVVTTAQLRVSITLAGLFCRWETRAGGAWRPAARDRPTQSYNFGWWDDRVYHYLEREKDEKYFGLGERAGDANRAGHSYRMTNLDAMGYSARTTDPLYKHIPFYITWKPALQTPLGLFYDTLADCTFDMGRELDNYHGLYRSFIADAGDLDYYVIAGDSPADITRRFTWLTGRPAFLPKWSLGYSGSTMAYTDAPDAQKRMDQFLEDCEKYDILCDSFHLSSGYTSIGDKRYVFTWNRDKFPDPAGFVRRYLEHGVHLCANIKPCLLDDHPRFAEAEEKGLFVHSADKSPALVEFWGGVGAHFDFTNPEAIAWWEARVKDALLDFGVSSTWNDNNEFEIWSDSALIDGFGTPYKAKHAKPLQTLLMLQTSCHAQKAYAPDTRPFLISRAGVAGMQRYVQTWSGDNSTSWETLKYNIRMGAGLALSGVSNIGHDVGGFAGPPPDPELFLRWVQFGILMPRFSIHSWNDDGSVTAPWMYPEITGHVRDLIKFRYRLIPYIYDLLWKSHSLYEPMIRPTFYDFPEDDRCFDENDDMLLGPSLLVAAVVEPGARARRVYLPAGDAWYDFWTGDCYEGGQEIVLPAPWDRTPLLARAGSAIPLNLAEQHFARPAERRGFAIFPHPGPGSFSSAFHEDDGESMNYRDGLYGEWKIAVDSDLASVIVAVKAAGRSAPSERDVILRLPRLELRRIIAREGAIVADRISDGCREVLVRL
jgi:alpha-glucosidase